MTRVLSSFSARDNSYAGVLSRAGVPRPVGLPSRQVFRQAPTTAQTSQDFSNTVRRNIWPSPATALDTAVEGLGDIATVPPITEIVIDNIRPQGDFDPLRFRQNLVKGTLLRADELVLVDFHNRYTFVLLHSGAAPRFARAIDDGLIKLRGVSEESQPRVVRNYHPLKTSALSPRERSLYSASDQQQRVSEQYIRRMTRALRILNRLPQTPANLNAKLFIHMRLREAQSEPVAAASPEVPSSIPAPPSLRRSDASDIVAEATQPDPVRQLPAETPSDEPLSRRNAPSPELDDPTPQPSLVPPPRPLDSLMKATPPPRKEKTSPNSDDKPLSRKLQRLADTATSSTTPLLAYPAPPRSDEVEPST